MRLTRAAEMLFVGSEFLDALAEIRDQLKTVREVIVTDQGFAAWRDRQPDTDPNLPTEGSDVCVQLYTSGATGHPKGAPLTNANLAGFLLDPRRSRRLGFDPEQVSRRRPQPGHAWPLGDVVETPPSPPDEIARALDGFFARSAGAYGILIATPERILCERYYAFGAADRATPSWSMTKAITCTVIGRLIQEGWLASANDPAPAPLWRDPRAIHRVITLDHLLRMRSGLAFPVAHGDGRVTLGFENSAVYQDAGDAFEAAQRSIVATVPGANGCATPLARCCASADDDASERVT